MDYEDFDDDLTDEEREALEELKRLEDEADDTAPEFDPDAAHKGADLDEDEEEEEEGEEDPGATGAGAGDEEGDEKQPEQQPIQQQAPPQDQRAPLFVAEAPEGAQERLEAIARERADARTKYDNGEIDETEYDNLKDKLADERTEILLSLKEAEIAEKMAQQQEVAAREQQITTFLKDAGIKKDDADPQYQALNRAVAVVMKDPDMQGKSVTEILEEAHRYGVFKGTLQAKPGQKEQQPPPKRQIKAPKTLANLPASEITGTESEHFARLDRIKDPDAMEREFQKMSPAQQEAYLMRG